MDSDSAAQKAVIASSDGTNGFFVWYAGAAISCDVEEYGLVGTHDVQLPGEVLKGISIWKGTARMIEDYESGKIDDIEYSGGYRAPTELEWMEIKEGRNPFGEQPDWREEAAPDER
tara:strand:+ start:231 stop:578 length:348 start_codon:yes stop_codon:yes gene_type:complete